MDQMKFIAESRKNVLRAFERDGTTAMAAGGDLL